jgi:hypothetical protein
VSYAVTAVRSTPVASSDPDGPAGTTGATLLPDATSLSGGGIDDALGVLYMAMAQQSQNSMQAGQATVTTDQKEEQKELADQQAAVAKEQANQANQGRGFFSSIGHLVGDVTKDVTHLDPKDLVKDSVDDVKDAANSPAFWNDLEKGALVVAKVAAVVGSAVATAASLGTAGVTIAGAAVLLSVGCEVGGEAVTDTKCFGNDSAGVGLGLQLTGVVAGLAGGFLSPGATAASKTALAIGAAFSGFGGEAQMVAGGAHVENQDFAATVQSATADAQHAVNQNAELEQTVGWEIDDLKATDKTHKGTTQALQGAIQANDQSTTAAAASISVKG